ncbi:hypothetical protein [Mediterranea massiliensis]|uniref:hypothetical protein n=1 Tax=Mediterranea massiliensis TaxID=1841865 RepID=UPI0025A3FE91|nr:hypothetical protein [Mediterranea massiliensis]MDM8337737.1 hypothetical protein [Mediterranea massiliensis]
MPIQKSREPTSLLTMSDEEKAKIEKLPGSFLHIHANDMQEAGVLLYFYAKTMHFKRPGSRFGKR